MTIIAPLYITQSPELETAWKTKKRGTVQSSDVAHRDSGEPRCVIECCCKKWKPADLTRKPNRGFEIILGTWQYC